jgi:hypothetical protein
MDWDSKVASSGFDCAGSGFGSVDFGCIHIRFVGIAIEVDSERRDGCKIGRLDLLDQASIL